MTLVIRPAAEADLPALFAYLNDHLSDNGRGDTALFMPIARSESGFPRDKEANLRRGITLPVGHPGWRRPWLPATNSYLCRRKA